MLIIIITLCFIRCPFVDRCEFRKINLKSKWRKMSTFVRNSPMNYSLFFFLLDISRFTNKWDTMMKDNRVCLFRATSVVKVFLVFLLYFTKYEEFLRSSTINTKQKKEFLVHFRIFFLNISKVILRKSKWDELDEKSISSLFDNNLNLFICRISLGIFLLRIFQQKWWKYFFFIKRSSSQWIFLWIFEQFHV